MTQMHCNCDNILKSCNTIIEAVHCDYCLTQKHRHTDKQTDYLYLTCTCMQLASFPGLHAQLLLLAVQKAGEGLDGFIT